MKYAVTSYHDSDDQCRCPQEKSSDDCHPVAGAVVGGTIGGAIGGPIGAVVGAFIGGAIGAAGCSGSEDSSDCSCSRKQ